MTVVLSKSAKFDETIMAEAARGSYANDNEDNYEDADYSDAAFRDPRIPDVGEGDGSNLAELIAARMQLSGGGAEGGAPSSSSLIPDPAVRANSGSSGSSGGSGNSLGMRSNTGGASNGLGVGGGYPPMMGTTFAQANGGRFSTYSRQEGGFAQPGQEGGYPQGPFAQGTVLQPPIDMRVMGGGGGGVGGGDGNYPQQNWQQSQGGNYSQAMPSGQYAQAQLAAQLQSQQQQQGMLSDYSHMRDALEAAEHPGGNLGDITHPSSS